MDLVSEADLVETQSPLLTSPSSPIQGRMLTKRYRSEYGYSTDAGIDTEAMGGKISNAAIRQVDLFHERITHQLERSHGAERNIISDKIQDFMAHRKSSFQTQSRSWRREIQSAFATLCEKQNIKMHGRGNVWIC